MGRQFAVQTDSGSASDVVLLIDVDTNEVETADATLEYFHEQVLVENKEDVLHLARFLEWKQLVHADLGWKECVSPSVPLVLGGSDDIDALEVTDMKLHWDILGQIWQQVRGLPPGTPIEEIKISKR